MESAVESMELFQSKNPIRCRAGGRCLPKAQPTAGAELVPGSGDVGPMMIPSLDQDPQAGRTSGVHTVSNAKMLNTLRCRCMVCILTYDLILVLDGERVMQSC